jgi:hypothetical protein
MYLLIFMFLAFIPIRAMDKSPETRLEKACVLTELEKTFLHAAFSGNTLLFSHCLDKGVDCNVADESIMGGYGRGHTALATICLSGHYLLLPLILNTPGIDVNKTDTEGNTALHYAAIHSATQTPQAHALLFASLIQKGAQVNAQNKCFETPLSLLFTVVGQPAQLSELLIENGADISLSIPFANPVNPEQPIVSETIFERVIRCNNPLHLIALLKSYKGITKPIILKALILTKFGFRNSNWGNTLWPKSLAQENLKANSKTMAQILKRYYNAMQGLGFGTKPTEDNDPIWQRHPTPHSVAIPIEIAKKIAWHAAKDSLFTRFEKRCLTILVGETKPHASKHADTDNKE